MVDVLRLPGFETMSEGAVLRIYTTKVCLGGHKAKRNRKVLNYWDFSAVSSFLRKSPFCEDWERARNNSGMSVLKLQVWSRTDSSGVVRGP